MAANEQSDGAIPAPAETPSPADATRRTSRWRRIGARLALLGATLSLLLVVLEIAVRNFTEIVPPLTFQDADVGKRYMRGFEDDVYVDEAQRKVHFRFNSEGFRGPDHEKIKPANVRRVAVLGDSEIAALSVDEKDTMVCRLERMLASSAPNVRWEVMNFGVAGSSPGQEMVLYEKVVTEYDPDIVLVGFTVGNDLADNCNRLSNNPRIYFDVDESGELVQQPFSAKRAAVSQFLNRYSRFYVWQKHAFRVARVRVNEVVQQINPGQWIYCTEPPEDVSHAWDITAAILREFKEKVEADGRMFAVVMIPGAEQVHRDYYEAVAERAGEAGVAFDQDFPERKVAELCREADIAFISPVSDYRAAAPTGLQSAEDEWLFQLGSGHTNAEGNLLTAKRVHAFLTQGDASVAGAPFISRLR